jgi:tripartite-type tricarboxylate transporter receptor subunit TctC
MPRRFAQLILFLPLLLLALPLADRAHAQAYPTKPVKIISDSAPGSAIDTNLRIIADGLSKQWGQQVWLRTGWRRRRHLGDGRCGGRA